MANITYSDAVQGAKFSTGTEHFTLSGTYRRSTESGKVVELTASARPAGGLPVPDTAHLVLRNGAPAIQLTGPLTRAELDEIFTAFDAVLEDIAAGGESASGSGQKQDTAGNDSPDEE